MLAAAPAFRCPLYQDAAESTSLLNNAEVGSRWSRTGAGRQDAEARERARPARHIYRRSRGLGKYRDPGLASDERLARGCRRPGANPGLSTPRSRRPPGDVSVMLYLRHHRQSKGAVPDARSLHRPRGPAGFDQSHRCRGVCPACRWPGSAITSSARAWLVAGSINCPESADTVMTDLREIGPTLLLRAAAGSRTC